MRNITFFVLLSFFSCKKNKFSKKKIEKPKAGYVLDSLKCKRALAVVEASYIGFEGGDKYHYARVEVLEVIKNKSNIQIKDTILIANRSWERGFEDSIGIAYLKFDPNMKIWMMLQD